MPRLSSAVTSVLAAASSCGLVVVLVVSALSLDASRGRYVFVAVLALLALAVCVALPVESLPAAALLVLVLVPDRVADYTISPVLTPVTAILVIWVGRKLLSRARPVRATSLQPTGRLRRTLSVAAVLLAVGMVPLVVVSPVKRFSVAWVFTFVVGVVAPLLVGDIEEEARRMRRALPWIASVVAVYAVAQSLAQRNFVYTPIYHALGLAELQHWAVYRADASLGHPLTAGLFFSAALAFCTGRWLETGRRRFALAALLNGLGIVTTVSRGSYIAAAVAVVLVLVVALVVHQRHRVRRLLLLALFAGGGALAMSSEAFVERGVSEEGVSSLNARAAVPQIAAETARAHHWLGGGPANSLPLAEPFNFQDLPIENSYLQLLVDVGAWGLALFLLILVLAVLAALRRRNLSAMGALIAYATAIAGYAALDSRRDLVVLLGLLVMMSLLRPEQRAPGRASVRTSHVARHGRSWTQRRRVGPVELPGPGPAPARAGAVGEPVLVGGTHGG